MTKLDVTSYLLMRQLAAFDTQHFEFGIRSQKSGMMLRRQWGLPEALRSVGWLKYQNALGSHVYVRPGDQAPIVLVDDVSTNTLLQMEFDAVHCLCIVETSPLNFQAWIRVAQDPIAPEILTCCGELLARRYEADLGSKDFRHLGRAAGFTNVKPHHIQGDGRFPFTRLTEDRGLSMENGDSLVNDAKVLWAKKQSKRAAALRSIRKARQVGDLGETSMLFQQFVEGTCQRYGASVDMSRAEAAAARRLALMGHTSAQITAALLNDAGIAIRKAGHLEDYVQRTVSWALGDTEDHAVVGPCGPDDQGGKGE